MKKMIYLVPLMFLLSIFFVNAGVNFECNVTAITTINENTNVSASFSRGNAIAADATNFYGEFYLYSAGKTQNTSRATLVANFSNQTRDVVNFTMPAATATMVIQDGNDYVVGVSIWNGTSSSLGQDNVNYTSCTVNRTGVNVDRLKPKVATGITFTNPVEVDKTITMTVNRNATTKCWILFGGTNVARRAMTLSGNTCTFTVSSNNPPNNDYQAFLQTDDETNFTNSNLQYITVKSTTSDGGGLFGGTLVTTTGGTGQQPFQPSSNNNNKNNIIIIILIILLIVWAKNKK